MAQIRFHVVLDVPHQVLSDEQYEDSMYYLKDCIQDLAEGLMGSVEDLEIK